MELRAFAICPQCSELYHPGAACRTCYPEAAPRPVPALESWFAEDWERPARRPRTLAPVRNRATVVALGALALLVLGLCSAMTVAILQS